MEGINKNNRRKPLNVAKIVNKALDDIQAEPCMICGYKFICGVKNKRLCKVNKVLRQKLMNVERMEEK